MYRFNIAGVIEYINSGGKSDIPDILDYYLRYEQRFYSTLKSQLNRGRCNKSTAATEISNILKIVGETPYRVLPLYMHEWSKRNYLKASPTVLSNDTVFWVSFSHYAEDIQLVCNILSVCIKGNRKYKVLVVNSSSDTLETIVDVQVNPAFDYVLDIVLEEYAITKSQGFPAPLPSWTDMYLGVKQCILN